MAITGAASLAIGAAAGLAAWLWPDAPREAAPDQEPVTGSAVGDEAAFIEVIVKFKADPVLAAAREGFWRDRDGARRSFAAWRRGPGRELFHEADLHAFTLGGEAVLRWPDNGAGDANARARALAAQIAARSDVEYCDANLAAEAQGPFVE